MVGGGKCGVEATVRASRNFVDVRTGVGPTEPESTSTAGLYAYPGRRIAFDLEFRNMWILSTHGVVGLQTLLHEGWDRRQGRRAAPGGRRRCTRRRLVTRIHENRAVKAVVLDVLPPEEPEGSSVFATS